MKKIVSLLALTFCLNYFSQAQKNELAYKKYTSIGMNVPMFIDNVLEIGVKRQFSKNFRIDYSLGGSNNTRGNFNNNGYSDGNYNYYRYDRSTYVTDEKGSTSTNYYYKDNKNKGVYSKVGFVGLINMSAFFLDGDKVKIQFYVGPQLGICSYKQSATEIKTVTFTPKSVANMSSVSTKTETKQDIKESGNKFGTGFSCGLTFVSDSKLSVDIGGDFIGYTNNSDKILRDGILGLGNRFVMRVSYNIK
jgi:hypothetical protein